MACCVRNTRSVGVNFHLNAKVSEVGKEGVTIEKEGKTARIEAEKVLVSVGRKANLSQVGLDKLNIELLRNGVKVDEHMQTSHPRVYACGDITGHSMLAHTAIRESEVAINHILGVGRPYELRLCTRCGVYQSRSSGSR